MFGHSKLHQRLIRIHLYCINHTHTHTHTHTYIYIIIIIFLHGLGRLACSIIDALFFCARSFIILSADIRGCDSLLYECFTFLGRVTSPSAKPPFLEDQFVSQSGFSLMVCPAWEALPGA
jgi:hypothetical protein